MLTRIAIRGVDTTKNGPQQVLLLFLRIWIRLDYAGSSTCSICRPHATHRLRSFPGADLAAAFLRDLPGIFPRSISFTSCSRTHMSFPALPGGFAGSTGVFQAWLGTNAISLVAGWLKKADSSLSVSSRRIAVIKKSFLNGETLVQKSLIISNLSIRHFAWQILFSRHRNSRPFVASPAAACATSGGTILIGSMIDST